MKLIYTDVNGDTYEVSIGFCFAHGLDELRVTGMPEPHKPAAGGRVTCKNITLDENECECYANVYSMKWIEREDQGWVHPEIELRNVLGMYEEMYDDDISGLDLLSVIDMMGQVDTDHLQHHPTFAKPILEWLVKNPTPAMLKRQSD